MRKIKAIMGMTGVSGMMRTLATILALTALCGPLGATGTDRGLNIPMAEERARMDGVLDDPLWKKALKLELRYEVRPGENTKPPVRTEVFIVSGKTELYVGFRAYDNDPGAIRARLTDRDTIMHTDDWVSVSLDTFNDQRRMYTFMCNPLGVQSDMVEANRHVDTGWDTIWASAGRITDDGYVVEMAIPFRALRFQRKKDGTAQIWGFDALRYYPRNHEHMMAYNSLDRNNPCTICQMSKIIGFKGARAGKNIEIDPSVSVLSQQQRRQGDNASGWDSDNDLDPGITAHWGFSPNMTLSGTVNPDFSQVEADVAQLDVNTQFALFYPEKRPFFMEGASIFSTRLKAIHTRSLADPEWGVKLTGKQGVHALGFYTARDSMTNLLFPGSQSSATTSLPTGSTGTVLRYRLDAGKNASTLGLLVTDREGGDYFNRLVGVDAFWQFNKKKSINLQLLGSNTRYPGDLADQHGQPGGRFSGHAVDMFFKHESRNIGYQLFYQEVSPGFRADLGFMPQVGYRNVRALFIAASWRNPGHWYTFLNIMPVVEYAEDTEGRMIHRRANLESIYMGPMQSVVQAVVSVGERAYMGQVFSTSYGTVYGEFKPSAAFHFQAQGIVGNHVDFANGRQGQHITFRSTVNYKAGLHLSLSLDHLFERFNAAGARLYTANVSNVRAVYQFGKRAFLRTILQYVDYDYNTDNYLFPVSPRFKHLFSQVLFSYKVNPRTVLFLGYSDDHYGAAAMPLTRNNRTLFLKIGYALML